MADPTIEEIESFLNTLADCLGMTVSLPEYSDLFESEDPSTAELITVATPDEIEAAFVMGLQRAEIEQKEAAEEKRVAEQWNIVSGISKRIESVPTSPTSRDLEIVEPVKLPKVAPLIDAAVKAFQLLSAARGEPDPVFEQATAESLKAIDERDSAIAQQHEEVKKEHERRRDAITDAKNEFGKIVVHEKGQEILKTSKGKTAKDYRASLAKYNETIQKLETNVNQNPPNVFNQLNEQAKQNIKDLSDNAEKINELAAAQVTQDRVVQFKKLPFKAPQIPATDLAVLSDELLKEQFEKDVSLWSAAHKEMFEQSKTFGRMDDFDKRLTEVEDLYAKARETLEKVTQGADDERRRRLEIVGQLKQLRASVQPPVVNPQAGTDEHVIYADCQVAYTDALNEINKLLTKGLAEEFFHAENTVREAISELNTKGVEVSELASNRETQKTLLKGEIQRGLDSTKITLASNLNTCPIPDVNKWVQDAFDRQASLLFGQVNGIDPANDLKIKSELIALQDAALKLTTILGAIDSAGYREVADNVVMKGTVKKLDEALKNPGVSSTAKTISEELKRDVSKILDRYEDIESLDFRYSEAVSDPKILPAKQKILKDFPNFNKIKNSLDKGELTIQYNTFLEAILAIDAQKEQNRLKEQSEEERKNYLASDSYKVARMIETKDTDRTIDPVSTLETLVSTGKARMGSITDAYRSIPDRPDLFSVEVEVLIDNYKDVVVHAHCSITGQPLPGSACHIKSWRCRYDKLWCTMTPPLRNALLPKASDCYAKAQSKGLVV